MARTNYRELYKKMLIDFIQEEDPVLSMLEWTAQQMMVKLRALFDMTLVLTFLFDKLILLEK